MASLAVIAQSSLLRAALTALLSTMGFAPVEEAAELKELMRRATDGRRPEFLLISLTHSEASSVSIQQIKEWAPEARVVCLAPSLDVSSLSACFAAGAAAYLLEDISRDGLLHSLRLVSAGENVFPSALASALSSPASRIGGRINPVEELHKVHATDLEIEILRCIANGETNSSIGKKFGISEAEVSVHIKHILRKLRVSNRTQAALWGVARGLAVPFGVLTKPTGNGEPEETPSDLKPPPARH